MYQLIFKQLGVPLKAENDKKTSIPANQLVAHLIGLILLCDDLMEAFGDFQALLQNGKAVSSSDRGFSVFDAHVTDCGCHLRAQMMQEILLFFKGKKHRKVFIFDAIAKKLNSLKEHCTRLIQSMCWENTSVQKLGFPKTIKSNEELLILLQWDTDDICNEIASNSPKDQNYCQNIKMNQTGT